MNTITPAFPMLAALLLGACGAEPKPDAGELRASAPVEDAAVAAPAPPSAYEQRRIEADRRWVTIYDGKPTCSAECARARATAGTGEAHHCEDAR
jgi:hypothetical protein